MTLPTTQTTDRQRQEDIDLRPGQPIPRVFLGAATLAAGNGGIARVARMSARALIGAGHAITMVSYLDDAPVAIGAATATPAHGSKLRFAAACHWAALHHSHFLYDSAGMARAHPRLPGLRRPYAVWIHGWEVWGRLGVRGDYANSIRNADLVLANSQFTLDGAQTVLGLLPNARRCWLGTESDAAPAARSLPDGPPTLLFLGRNDDLFAKGQDILVDAWPKVVSKIPDARLLFVGGGSHLPHLLDLVRASPMAGSIEVIGFQDDATVEKIWRQATAFAMLSYVEGFGLVYAEAMRHAVPILASTDDASREVNLDQVTGYNVARGDREGIIDRIILLLGDRDQSARLGLAGFERWRQHFRWSAFEARFRGAVTPWLRSGEIATEPPAI